MDKAQQQRDVFKDFGFYSVPDLTEEEKRPPEFIVEDMIPCGMTFLSGAPKLRKSFMALQLAIAVATGTPFLGFNTRRCDVVYLDLEGSKSRVSSRSEKMTIEIPGNIYFTNSTQFHIADKLVEQLRTLHRQHTSIRLFIIDTYARARGRVKTGGANSYDVDTQLLEPLQRMSLEEKIAVLLIHHDKKGAGLVTDTFERMSGTMAISGSADSVLSLVAEGKRFDGKASLEYTPRDAKGGEIKLVFDEAINEWCRLADMPPPDIRGNPVCNWVIENAPDRGQAPDFYTYSDVFKAAYRCMKSDAGDVIRKTLLEHRAELFTEYQLGIQVGVKLHGERGVRIINLA